MLFSSVRESVRGRAFYVSHGVSMIAVNYIASIFELAVSCPHHRAIWVQSAVASILMLAALLSSSASSPLQRRAIAGHSLTTILCSAVCSLVCAVGCVAMLERLVSFFWSGSSSDCTLHR